MLLSIFLPRSTVLRHYDGPQGGMLEQQKAEAVSQKNISASGPREVCLSPVHGTSTALQRQSIHEVMRRKHPSSALPIALGEVTAWHPGKRLRYWNSARYIGTDGKDAMPSPREKKIKPTRNRQVFLMGICLPYQNTTEEYLLISPHKVNCHWIAYLTSMSFHV